MMKHYKSESHIVNQSPARRRRAAGRRIIIITAILLIVGAGISFSFHDTMRAAAPPPQGTSPGRIWQDVAESSIKAQGRRETIPARYRTVRLDMNALKAVLAKAPLELTEAAKTSTLEITIPMPDGALARFKVEESPMMEPALAAKLPEIKTYQGYGLDDRSATMRFDITSRGFHAIILSAAGDVYIDPYAEDNTEHCISYYKRDFRQAVAEPFRCFTQESDAARSRPSGHVPNGAGFGTRYVFRLALAATGEYTNFFRLPGDTDSQALTKARDALVTTMNRVNAIYLRDISVFMIFVANSLNIIYLDPNTDPYTFPIGSVQVNQQNQENLDNVIGFDNYDIGHVVGISSGGRASLAGVCGDVKGQASTGQPTPVGDPFDVDFVAHEMGHQFGADHTFNDGTNGSCGNSTRVAVHAMEPGSGSTIMGYAGVCSIGDLQRNSDSYFHTRSIEQIFVWLLMPDGFDCATRLATGNVIPDFTPPASHTIPARTPFELYAGDLTDPDGGVITYCWEELDVGAPSPPEGDGDGQPRPIFRSYSPSLSPRRSFPSIFYILNNANNPPATYQCGTDSRGNPINCVTGESLPTITRTMTFRVTARDNQDGIAAEQLQVSVVGTAGPFNVVQPNTNVSWTKGARRTVTWNVANTNLAPINCANVKISLSIDNGLTFPYVLLGSTPNDGSEEVILPDVETIQARIKIEAVDNIFFDISDASFTIKPIEVTTEADNGNNNAPVQESLRDAIVAANNLPGIQAIPFNIPGAGVKTINLTTPLPAIEEPIIIDGWSQGPAGYSGPPLIELNGAGAGVNAAGLIINSGGSTIRGLAINRFSHSGIILQFAGGNTIQGCYIGTNADGTAALGNAIYGISINNVPNNLIGRQTAGAQGNLISGNAVGILLVGSNATGNTIRGNNIGTDVTGNARLSNTQDGIRITDAPVNTIGGTDPLAGNIISGNGASGASADGIEITGAAASGNMIFGNYIGLAANGNGGLGNLGSGVRVDNAPGTIIGGAGAAYRNVIADNRNQGGIALIGTGSSGTTIQGNYLGTNSTGNVAINNNATDIYAESANNHIGGTAPGEGNLISGFDTSGGIGIFLFGYPGSTGNTILGNYIGTNADGSARLSRAGTGIELRSGSTGTIIGGTIAAARNIISGNFTGIHDFTSNTIIQGNYIGTNAVGTAAVANSRGILIEGGTNHQIGGTIGTAGNVISGNGDSGVTLLTTSDSFVQGNRIGTNAAGTAALSNSGHGVNLFNSSNTLIGGTTAAARNIISANRDNGININGGSLNRVQGNYIGTDVNGTANLGNGQPNGLAGIEIQAGSHTIGGIAAGEGNLIAFNGCSGCFGVNSGSGIKVFSAGNRLRGNTIFGNAELGIDLSGGNEGANRVTPNDSCDADGGANNLQNFPVLTSAGNADGTTSIAGSLNSTAGASFTLDFYASPTCDASGNGEGQTYLGSMSVATDGSCNTSFALSLPIAVAVGQVITATATDAAGNTSEFSACTPVTASATIPAGNYNNLVINSGTTMTLAGDVTVTGILTLNGDLNTGPFTLTMPASANSTGTGDVIGTVRRTGITLGTPLSFGNPFNILRFDTGSPPTEVTVTLVKAAPPGFSNAVQRTYTITPTGGSNYSATLQLHYLDSELNGNDEATVQLWRNDGSAWSGQGATSRDAANNWVQLTGVTQFSPWTIAGPGGPTAIELVSFTATSYDNGTLLQWQTGFEADNLGFNVYREEAGKRVLINNQIVAGSALRASSVLRAGDRYGWWDASTNKPTAYWLEAIDLKGESRWHGPFFANLVGGNSPTHSDAALLGKLGRPRDEASATRVVEAIAQPPQVSSSNANLSINAVASAAAVKIFIKREGFYRLSQEELLAAGLQPSVDPRTLQLFVDGAEIPISVLTNKDGLLEAIEFYGLGLDTPSTEARAYWLVAGKQPGKRIRTVEAQGVSSSPPSFSTTVQRRDRSIYFAALRNGERENFFGAVITSQAVEQTLTLQNLAQQAESSTLEIALQGVTQTAHRVAVELNDVLAGFIDFNGQQPGVASFTLPHSLLREGLNTIHLTSQNGAGDVSLVDQIRLTYQHTYTADDNRLNFSAAGRQQLSIDGFTSKQIRVFDVTDSANPTQLMGNVSESKRGFVISCASQESGERRLFALADEQVQHPASVKANTPSNWRNPANAADLVIITPKRLFSSLDPLKRRRESQGYKIALVDIEDLYDEFSFGHQSPQALRDFLRFATLNWQLAPRFVLLVGDASYDPKNYLGLGEWDMVPTRLVDTTYMETAWDDWFADFRNREQAELAIGRLPVRSSEETTTVISKILRFEETKTPESVLLVSDANDGFNFEQASARLKNLFPASWRVEELQRGRLDAELAKARLIEALGRGQQLVNYVGHGSVNGWRGELLTAEEARKLENRQLPVFVLMNCLNGYFHDAQNEALGESLINGERGGAVAVWASSGMTLPGDQTAINQALYRLWFENGSKGLTIGEAVQKAKTATNNPDLRRTWILLGDPTMRVR